VLRALLCTKKCYYANDRLCRYLDFPVINNEFVHSLRSRVNVYGTLLQQTEAVKLFLDACINIIFLLPDSLPHFDQGLLKYKNRNV